MAEVRIGRGWSDAELRRRLRRLEDARRSVSEGWPVGPGWRAERSQAVIAVEEPGPPRPGGSFERASAAVARYAFSDPGIVAGHYLPGPLLGRRMLLELKVLGLRYLCGVVVGAVCDTTDERCTRWGYRYETLEGHIERGAEWFLLEKEHASGVVRFIIRSTWRHGDFPNLQSEVGFSLLSPYYRRVWLRRSHERLSALAQAGEHAPGTAAVEPLARRHALLAAAGLGSLTGLRSMSAPALLAYEDLRSGPRHDEQASERVLGAPSVFPLLSAAAVAEAIADKHPRMPPRISPLPLAGRLAMGALSGAALASRWRTPKASAAVVGAAAAGLTAAAGYGLRTALGRRGLSQRVLGLVEDGVVLGAALALALSDARPLARHVRRRAERAERIKAAAS